MAKSRIPLPVQEEQEEQEQQKTEVPEGTRELARAIAIANGHSSPDEYANRVCAAYVGDEVPEYATEEEQRAKKKAEEDEKAQAAEAERFKTDESVQRR